MSLRSTRLQPRSEILQPRTDTFRQRYSSGAFVQSPRTLQETRQAASVLNWVYHENGMNEAGCPGGTDVAVRSLLLRQRAVAPQL